MDTVKPTSGQKIYLLRLGLLAALGVLAVVLLGALFLFIRPVPKFELLGRLQDYPASGSPYDLHSTRGYILVVTAEEIIAYNPKAPRKTSCPVKWEAEQAVYRDPCLGTTFDPSGAYLSGPSSPPLERFLVRIEGDTIWVDRQEVDRGD